ncbi:MAG: hypothetical protein HOV87_09185 [Catenulispora sp.]|nr:hypothetical protein [Catenulispora sp.]
MNGRRHGRRVRVPAIVQIIDDHSDAAAEACHATVEDQANRDSAARSRACPASPATEPSALSPTS